MNSNRSNRSNTVSNHIDTHSINTKIAAMNCSSTSNNNSNTIATIGAQQFKNTTKY